MAPGDVVHDAESTIRHALWLKLARCLLDAWGRAARTAKWLGSHLGPWFSAGSRAYLAQNPDWRGAGIGRKLDRRTKGS
jgi:hypothetical protein